MYSTVTVIIDDNHDRDDDFHPIFGRDFATGDTGGEAIEGDTPRGPYVRIDGWNGFQTCFCHDSPYCFSFCDDTPPPFDPDVSYYGRHAVIVIGDDILTVDYAHALLGYVPDGDSTEPAPVWSGGNNLDHKR